MSTTKNAPAKGPEPSLGKKLLDAADHNNLPIGLHILKVAYEEYGGGTKENPHLVVSNRKDKRLLKYFTEGVKWNPDQWHGKADPHWCAAFASYCYRKAHERAGQNLPISLSALVSDLQKKADQEGRFLPMDQAVAGNQITSAGQKKIHPGDLIITNGHVAIFTGFTTDSKGQLCVNTIEGNTCIWRNGNSKDQIWGIHPKKNLVSKRSYVGFILGATPTAA